MALVINRLNLRRVSASEAGEALPAELHDVWWDVNLVLPWSAMSAIQRAINERGSLEAADVLIPAMVHDWNVQFEKEGGELVRADINAETVGKLPTELVVYMLMNEKDGLTSFLDRQFRAKKVA